LLIIETQVINFNSTGFIDWGTYNHVIPVVSIFGIIDEADQLNRENGVTGLALAPSREGLIWLLHRLGFTSVEVIALPADPYEQLATGKRIVVVAKK
jgi:tRNA (mo5U34)-methyltransferase